MRLPPVPVPDPEMASYFGSIYRDIGGDVDVQEPLHDTTYHHNGESQSNSRVGNGTPAQGEFSEYLWMEHEDEYDREVIRELEEEDMINYYFDLYQESLQPETREQEIDDAHIIRDLLRLVGHNNQTLTTNGATAEQPILATAGPSPRQGDGYQNYSNGEDLTSRGRIVFGSTLNPNAPEFIPRHLSNVQQDKPPASS